MSITVNRIGGRIGAEISGVDRTEQVDDVTAKEIHEALVEHKVLAFREGDEATHYTPRVR